MLSMPQVFEQSLFLFFQYCWNNESIFPFFLAFIIHFECLHRYLCIGCRVGTNRPIVAKTGLPGLVERNIATSSQISPKKRNRLIQTLAKLRRRTPCPPVSQRGPWGPSSPSRPPQRGCTQRSRLPSGPWQSAKERRDRGMGFKRQERLYDVRTTCW